MMKNLIRLWFLLSTTGCVHTIHSFKVEEEKRTLVESEVGKECAIDTCSVKRCWMETEDVLFCVVEFSFVSEKEQTKLLATVADNLQKHGVNAGLCGRDSFATQMLYSFIRGMGAGAASAALGGTGTHTAYFDTSKISYSTSDELNERLSIACLDEIHLVEKSN
ncbi:MAG: hypothetical protein KBD78_06835 [Oligoflexales bacterium]|nr:hypothetical protein [Oligoflexales bacterium]